jgi:hypothetical protein
MSGSKLFEIYEEDLETLERALPELYDSLRPEAKNRQDIREHAQMVKDVLSKVRWNYGPHVHTEVVRPEDEQSGDH